MSGDHFEGEVQMDVALTPIAETDRHLEDLR